MEYNKNRFQKANDKKILHKVKKQWVVLSVALLAAIGGGVTLTTHAKANADSSNGQNSDPATTIKNHINQNLKLAQSQNSGNQNQTQQTSALNSKNIVKQASILHNRILNNAANANNTNAKSVNGRQQSAEPQASGAAQLHDRIASNAAGVASTASTAANAASSAAGLGMTRRLLGNTAQTTPTAKSATITQQFNNANGSTANDTSNIALNNGSATIDSTNPILQPSDYQLDSINGSTVSGITKLMYSNSEWSWYGSSAASLGKSSAMQLTYKAASTVNYYVPVKRVFYNADGTTEQQTYDNENDQLKPNSDIINVRIHGVVPTSGSTEVKINNSAYAYDSGFNSLGSAIEPAGYSLMSGVPSLVADIQANGQWNWSNTANDSADRSTPTLEYQASATGGDINVQYINQTGYRVSAAARKGAGNNNASLLSSGSFAGDVNYSGAGSYGDTINILGGLSLTGKPTKSAMGQVNSDYDYGFNSDDSVLPFSDYSFTSSEQTATLRIRGRKIPSSGYASLAVNVRAFNHKGQLASSSTVNVNFSSDHYGDLVPIDPTNVKYTGGKDYIVTPSDYQDEPSKYNSDTVTYDTGNKLASGSSLSSDQKKAGYTTDSTGEIYGKTDGAIPMVYLSEKGPEWISLNNRSDAISEGVQNSAGAGSADATKKGLGVSAGAADQITFNYNYGNTLGTAAPIHVTYRDQNNNVVGQGNITPTSSEYGDQINIPAGTNITHPSDESMFGSGSARTAVTLPAGFTLDYDKNNANGFDHYDLNSDVNSSAYQMYQSDTNTPSGSATTFSNNSLFTNAKGSQVAGGQDLTIYVLGKYQATNTGNNSLRATVQEITSDASGSASVAASGTIPININGFAGESRIVNPQDFKSETFTSGTNSDGIKLDKAFGKNDTLTPSDEPYKITFNGDNKLSVEVWDPKAKVIKTHTVGSGANAHVSDVKSGNSLVTTTSAEWIPVSSGQFDPTSAASSSIASNFAPSSGATTLDKNGLVFKFHVPTSKVASHNIHIRYFYSDMSDIPNGETPKSNRKLIPLSDTNVSDNVPVNQMGSNGKVTQVKSFNINPYIANPPKGYQFVKILSNSNDGNNQEDFSHVLPKAGNNDKSDATVNLDPNASSDTVDIKLVPTAGSISFHYYNQNGNPVDPDPSGKMANESDADFSNSNNVHTEFGNVKDNPNNTKAAYGQAANYYSRYGTYADVYNIPVPNGYHIDPSSMKQMTRYYRFGREHQDINVMVVGNKNDVANTPNNPSDPGITSGDVDSTNTSASEVVPILQRYTSNTSASGSKGTSSYVPAHSSGDPILTSSGLPSYSNSTVSLMSGNGSYSLSATGVSNRYYKTSSANNSKFSGIYAGTTVNDPYMMTKVPVMTNHRDADTVWVTIHEMSKNKHEFRSYTVPSYVTGANGDQFHLYANNFTPEAKFNQSGETMYYFQPFQSGAVHDTGADVTSNTKIPSGETSSNAEDNYIEADGNINNDGTVTANGTTNSEVSAMGLAASDNDFASNIPKTALKNGNHVDFYYQLVNTDTNLKPINVTYMDGSRAVGFKQIIPNSDDFDNEKINNVVSDKTSDGKPGKGTQGTLNGDTINGVPQGYKETMSDGSGKGIPKPYPVSINDTHAQDIVIPVQKNTIYEKKQSVPYKVIYNFYNGSMGDKSDLIGASESNASFSDAYSGEMDTVSASASMIYNSAIYSGDSSENSRVDMEVYRTGYSNSSVSVSGNKTSTVSVPVLSATPNVAVYNYYLNNNAVNPRQSGAQSTSGKLPKSVAEPLYVQYYAGSSATSFAPNDYAIGQDNELTGPFGTNYSNVTTVVPVPAGYHVTTPASSLSGSIGNVPSQIDVHLARNNPSDANFPLNIVLASGNNVLTSYTDNYDISNGGSGTSFSEASYNPNSSEFSNVASISTASGVIKQTSSSFTVHNVDGDMTYPSGTLIYQVTSSGINKPITVHYINENTGSDVGSSESLAGKYAGQNYSDITTTTGHTSTSANPQSTAIPSGFSGVANQRKDYQITNDSQVVDYLVSPKSDTNGHYKVNVVEEDPKTGYDTYLSDVASGVTSANTTLDPASYLPASYATSVTPSGSSAKSGDYVADPKSTQYFVDPANSIHTIPAGQSGTVTFVYDTGHTHARGGAIVLRYYDQNGQQVGYTDVINGKGSYTTGSGKSAVLHKYNRYGQRIDVTNNLGTKANPGDNSDSTGEGVPNGYELDQTTPGQVTHYTFNNDVQNVNLFVHGLKKSGSLQIILHKMNKQDPSGSMPSDVTSMDYPTYDPAGSTLTFDPNNYVPSGYQTLASKNHDASAKVNPDGSVTPNVINFYYNQNTTTLAKPYILRYVNQNGQQVGFDDVISNPDVMKQYMNLTDPKDGGEAVPKGYHLASDATITSNGTDHSATSKQYEYNNQHAYKYKFGNDHTVTLKVDGDAVHVNLPIYQVEQASDNRPSDATHTYTHNISYDGRIGDSFKINADMYNPDKNNYSVDPHDTTKTVTITGVAPNASKSTKSESDPSDSSKQIQVPFWTQGIASIKENGTNDNQAVFYYDPTTNEHPSRINVYYIDQDTGQEITSGYINPSDVTKNASYKTDTNNNLTTNGNTQVGTTMSDVANVVTKTNGNGKVNGHNNGVPNEYQLVKDSNGKDIKVPATFMHNEQNVYVPVQANVVNPTVKIIRHLFNNAGSQIGTLSSSDTFSAGTNSDITYSPYDYMPTGKYGSDFYATNSDNDQNIQVEGSDTYTINWNYRQTADASDMQLGTINVHYVTSGTNNGQNIKMSDISNNKTTYYQVDQESDHGFNGDSFNLNDYLNDVPSYNQNFYHLAPTKTSDNPTAIVGYNDIKGTQSSQGSNDYLPWKVSSNGVVSDGTFKTATSSDTHPVYGDPTYAIKDASDKNAKDTQDIYVLVAPNASNIPNNQGNEDNSQKASGASNAPADGNDQEPASNSPLSGNAYDSNNTSPTIPSGAPVTQSSTSQPSTPGRQGGSSKK